jgi:hypothetical protein
MSGNPLTRRTLLGGGLLVGLGWATGQLWGHRPMAAIDSPFLGSAGRRTLEGALEALLPEGAAVETVAADVDRFLAAGDPVIGGQLVLALGALEHLGGAGFRRFSRLSRDERTAVLEGWRTSALGPKRRIADALRRVALFSWYARPETWDRIGYDGPWVGR